MNNTILLYVAVAFVAFMIGLSKGGLGGTIVVLVTPLLALVLGPGRENHAVGLALPLLLVGDVCAIALFWKRWDTRLVGRLLPGTVVGVLIGSFLLPYLSATVVRISIAVLVLLYCAYKVLEPRLRRDLATSQIRPWYASIFGGGTGIASTVANAGGPIASVFLLMHQLSPTEFIADSAIYFALINTMKLPGFISSGVLNLNEFAQVAWSIPLILLGVAAGKYVVRILLPEQFERAILVLLFITAVFLLTRG